MTRNPTRPNPDLPIDRKTERIRKEKIHEILGMENPDPKPTIEQVEIPNIPLANQPSVCIPPSTNRNLRNIQLADLDMAQELFKNLCSLVTYLELLFLAITW